MITIKNLKDLIIGQTLPHDVINIEVFDNHVVFLGLHIKSNKPYISEIPNYIQNVGINAFEIYKTLSNYEESSEAYIASFENHLRISDSNYDGTFLSKSNHILIINNDWSSALNYLGKYNG
jgi:hypothetical protein